MSVLLGSAPPLHPTPARCSEPCTKPKAKGMSQSSALCFLASCTAWQHNVNTIPYCCFYSTQWMWYGNAWRSPPGEERTSRTADVVGCMAWGDHLKRYVEKWSIRWGDNATSADFFWMIQGTENMSRFNFREFYIIPYVFFIQNE